jgi:hypothetical protein
MRLNPFCRTRAARSPKRCADELGGTVGLAVLGLCGALLLGSVAGSGCNTDDTGHACGSPNQSLAASPVADENSLSTVVSLYRDANCNSFQCVAAGGLNPYCTRPCTYRALVKPIACLLDSACAAPSHCIKGQCTDDDCPHGFWCQVAQEVGQFAGQPFCVRRGCASDIDCGDIGNISCAVQGCYDHCLRDPKCAAHTSQCELLSLLNCKCQNGAPSCADSLLTCQPAGQAAPWPQGAVTRQGVCQPKH